MLALLRVKNNWVCRNMFEICPFTHSATSPLTFLDWLRVICYAVIFGNISDDQVLAAHLCTCALKGAFNYHLQLSVQYWHWQVCRMQYIIGLSKERPILDHHAKAHIHEIWRISPEIHPQPYKIRCFNQNYSVWWMQERGLWPWISWNPPDFTGEIHQISWVKSTGFHLWNRKTNCQEW